jgi:cysteine desulfurase family protein
MRRIYVDNAATSWPKPEAVYEAVDRYLRECGAPAGRAAYADAVSASRIVAQARKSIARLLGVDDVRRIVFTLNGTDALNIAIHGVVRAGDHVVTTHAEHNSVLRPLRFLEETKKVEVTRVPCDAAGFVDPGDIAAAIRPNTRLVAVTHASNVTGALQPIAEIVVAVRERGALLLVDAAQSLGHVPVSFDELSADLLAAPGHKGLLGPLGTGVLVVGPRAESQITSFRQGGTGTQSEDDRQPDELPERLEAGNHNVAGIAGLAAGVEYLLDRGIDEIRRDERALTGRLLEGLRGTANVTVHAPVDLERQVGVVSVSIADYDPQEVAAALDSGYGIQVRSGLHCAPLIHKQIGSDVASGTVRFSVGPFNTEADVESILAAVEEIASAAVGA